MVRRASGYRDTVFRLRPGLDIALPESGEAWPRLAGKEKVAGVCMCVFARSCTRACLPNESPSLSV